MSIQTNQKLFKKISVIFLLFVIIGALFLCVFAATTPMNSGSHDMPLNNEMLIMHSLHIKELTLGIIIKTSFDFSIFILMVVFAVFISLYKEDPFIKFTLLSSVRKKFYDILHSVQIEFCQWLSLFEGSPNFS